ncbi:MAG: alpha-amylase family glycosyl hydrolase, partial [Sediminibacterium sp.]
MYQHSIHARIAEIANQLVVKKDADYQAFFTRLIANAAAIDSLFLSIYGNHPQAEEQFKKLISTIVQAHQARRGALKKSDEKKLNKGNWHLSQEIVGMSLYVDRFAGNIEGVGERLDYLNDLGVNFLHLMPIFESPLGESDGGYAVSDFRKIDSRFGTLEDLHSLKLEMEEKGMYLMLDFVLNHTSHHHEWALKAKAGDPVYRDFYYMYDDRQVPNQLDATMPEIFPESSPGNFTYIKECRQWVMTVFHHYQWDLNYTNPAVFNAMLDNLFFYANLGVDIVRIDAPAFIWKKIGTTCQNLPEAHTLLCLLKQCLQVAAPGVALLGEAIVAPAEIMKYFGQGLYTGRECDFAYNATQMALQWDALATGDTRIMLAAQPLLAQKPIGSSWITYTRCHDDIGLGYDDSMIASAGFQPYAHRKFLKEYYSGAHPDSPATGALFSVNPKTQDARISGSLASLCGLEKAQRDNSSSGRSIAIRKIMLMQANSFMLGGIPILFYGDEQGLVNDYSYLSDPGKSYDNRWMHRPLINWKIWEKESNADGQEIFKATQQLIRIRKKLPALADLGNIRWLTPHNIHVAGFIREIPGQCIYCLFNYSLTSSYLTWYAFKESGRSAKQLYDHWSGRKIETGPDHEY